MVPVMPWRPDCAPCIGPMQARVLRQVAKGGPQTAREITTALKAEQGMPPVSESSIETITVHLVRKRLVRRHPPRVSGVAVDGLAVWAGPISEAVPYAEIERRVATWFLQMYFHNDLQAFQAALTREPINET